MTTHKVLCGNSCDMKEIPSGSAQLVVTSPPYPMIEMWDDVFASQYPSIRGNLKSGWGSVAYNKMHNILDCVWQECDRILCDGGFVCINIGDATRTISGNFQMYPNHARVIKLFEECGYTTLPSILWHKRVNSPNKFMGSGMYPAGAYVTLEHEYILVFRKGGKRKFSDEEKLRRRKSAYFWEERNVWFSDIWRVNGTSQTIATQTPTRNRSASFPFEIPYRLVNMYSIEGDTVVDPFAGLGTTMLACMASQRNSIGIDIDSAIVELAKQRMVSAKDELNEVIGSRIDNHVRFIKELPEEKRGNCYWNSVLDVEVKTKQEMDIDIRTIESICLEDSVSCCYKEVLSWN